MKTNTKTKIKNTLKTILAIIIVLTLIWGYNIHEDNSRSEYARTHGCTWVIQGSHDICK